MLAGLAAVTPAQPVAAQERLLVRQGSIGPHVRQLQLWLSITADGIFGPATRAAVIAFQRRNNLLPDGVVGRMTWAALAR